jgi:DNA-binding MarR family transcriptional regulator
MLAGHGLTPHHFGVLMVLGQLGSASQQQLSRAIGVDPRNAVPVLDVLQERRLVRRRPDPGDRRRHAVELTQAGRAMLDKLRRDGTEVEDRFLDCLSATERAALHKALGKLLAAPDRG